MIARRLGNKQSEGSGGIDANTLLMLHGEDFTDSSLNAVAMNKTGTIYISTSGKFNYCLYFGGGYFSQTITLGTSNFTIDFWCNRVTGSTTNYPTIYATAEGGTVGGFYIDFEANTNYLRFVVTYPARKLRDTQAFPLGVWTHVAFVRSGTTLTLYRNGVAQNNVPLPIGHNFSLNSCKIGVSISNTSPVNSYIDEFRISNVARWTANFTPPTQPYYEG